MKKINLLVMCLMLTSCNISVGDYSYSNSDKYLSADELTLNEEITTIKFDWISGNIKVSQALDNQFYFKEEAKNDRYPMHYWLNGSQLNIQFVKSGTLQSEINNFSKDVELIIPASIEKLEFDIVDSNLNFEGLLSLTKLDVDCVDGDINIQSITAETIDIDRVDGDLAIQNIESTYSVKIDIDSVDGEDKIYIKEEQGYIVDFDSISNKFESEYSNLTEYGNKLIEIDYDTVDSKLKIIKG